MNLLLLQDSPQVTVYYDACNDWLFTDWHGELSLADVQTGCLTIAQCFLERTYPHILNNNSDVTGMSALVPQWLAQVYLPHLGVAGIEYVAWVCAPSVLLRHLAHESVQQLCAPAVTTFDNLADACTWLQSKRRPLPPSAPPLEQHARLHKRVNLLTQELQHGQLAAGRAGH
jgi:hypothetical protein